MPLVWNIEFLGFVFVGKVFRLDESLGPFRCSSCVHYLVVLYAYQSMVI